MPIHYRQIAVADIDLSNTQYALNPFASTEPDAALQKSIQTHGILHPPLLLEQSENRYIVLSGRKRLVAAVENAGPRLTALVIHQAEARNTLFIFSTLLQHRLIGSSLSCIEQAVFFQKVLKNLPAEDMLQFLPLLEHKEKAHIPTEFISLLKLAPQAQRSLHEGRLSLRAGKDLLRFSADDQQYLTALILELQLGGSKQRKMLDQVYELTQRNGNTAAELLAGWLKNEKDKQHNGPQKATSLLRWLQRQCSPQSTAAEEDFGQFARQLKLPDNVRLSHTLSFEDTQVTLNIDFRSRQQLVEKWPQIQSILQEKQ